MAIPFNITTPISSIVTLLVGCFTITLALSLSSFLIMHEIQLKRIFLLSLLAYLLTPVISSLITLPMAIYYILPIAVWVILSEILLKKVNMKTRAIIATLGYVIFLIFIYIGLWSFVYSMIPF